MNSKSSSNSFKTKDSANCGNGKTKLKNKRPIILLRRSSCGQITSKYGQSKKERDKKYLKPNTQKLRRNSSSSGVDYILNCYERPKSAAASIGARSITPVESIFVSPAISVANIKRECNTEEKAWLKNVKIEKENINTFVNQAPIFQNNGTIKTEPNNVPIQVNPISNFNAFPTIVQPYQAPLCSASYVPVLTNQNFSQNQVMLNNNVSFNVFPQNINTIQRQYVLSNQVFQQPLLTSSDKNSMSQLSSFAAPELLLTAPQNIQQNPPNAPLTQSNPSIPLSDIKYMIDQNNNIHIENQDQQAIMNSKPDKVLLQVDSVESSNSFIPPQAPTIKPKERPIRCSETNTVDDSLTNITWLGRMGVNSFLPVPIEKDKNCRLSLHKNDKGGRPPYSYMALIQFAINSTPQKRMTLRQVYQWIEEKFPYFKTAKPGWKNSIRHNLSLHDIFVREVASGSKSSYWTLRSDLNQRPLTLDSVKGSSHHLFNCQNQALWGSQPTKPGQKTLLPRLDGLQGVVVPMLPDVKQEMFESQKTQESEENKEIEIPRCDENNYSFINADLFSDLKPMEEGSATKNLAAKSDNPMLSQAYKKITSGVRKRQRKEPLKTLNDSLDNSFQFMKSNSPSTTANISPFVPYRTRNSRKDDQGTPRTLGISDQSFSDIMNDLGSPFQSFFKGASHGLPTPDTGHSKQTQHKPVSPVTMFTPVSRKKRVRKTSLSLLTPPKSKQSNAGSDLTFHENVQHSPILTPKSKKSLKENFGSPGQKSTPFNIMKKSKSPMRKIVIESPCRTNLNNNPDFQNDFLNDLIGTVLKTPERPNTNITKLVSPIHPNTMSDISNLPSTSNNFHNNYNNTNQILPSVFGSSNDTTSLNTSFSKLLDLSGISLLGGSIGSNGNYGDLADISWSHLAHLE